MSLHPYTLIVFHALEHARSAPGEKVTVACAAGDDPLWQAKVALHLIHLGDLGSGRQENEAVAEALRTGVLQFANGSSVTFISGSATEPEAY
jgi:hypothetical protein